MPSLQRIAHSLSLLTAVALVTVGLLTSLVLRDLSRWDAMAARMTRESQEASLDGILHSAITRATGEAVSFAATGKQEYAREATDALLFAQSAMTQLRRSASELPATAEHEAIRGLRKHQQELLSRVRRSVTSALRVRPAGSALTPEQLEQLYTPESDSDRTWLEVLAWHDNERKTLARSLRSLRHRVLALVGATVLVSLLWAVLLRILIGRNLVSPIEQLAHIARRVADGELELQAPVTGSAEIGALQNAFNRIVRELRAARQLPAAAGSDEVGAVAQSESDARHRPAPSPVPAAASDLADWADPLADKHALLVASDPAERDLTQAMLKHCGVRVTLVEGVQDAIAALQRETFELIVVASPLSDADDIDAIARLRSAPHGGAPLPIISVAAEDAVADLPRRIAAGIDEQLTRPVSFFDLHAALTRQLSRR